MSISRPHTVGFNLRSKFINKVEYFSPNIFQSCENLTFPPSRFYHSNLGSQSTAGAMSVTDLPNLPGIRPNVGATNPRLYREFKASRQGSRPAQGEVAVGDEGFSRYQSMMTPAVEEENSLLSYFQNAENMRDYSKSMSPFPANAPAYNDVNGRYSLKSQQADRLSGSRALPYSSLDNVPAFVKNSTQICTFMAYFIEEAPENLLETTRARNVEITFHLEDNTIDMSEPRVKNSGLSQGKLLKRHQVPKPGPGRQGRVTPGPLATGALQQIPIFTIMDAYAGAELDIYNRIYTINDADEATKKYLASIGRPFGNPLPTSSSYWDPEKRPGNLRSKKKHYKTVKNLGFYEYERKVLRFFGVWDGGEQLFGDEQYVRIHYSLADNKIEVLPIHQRNSGRDKLSKLLKKTVILKKGDEGLEYFPSSYSRVLTATGLRPDTGTSTFAGASNMGSSQMVYAPDRPYHWNDLAIGEMISVASLFILITDADEYTREFYVSKNRPLAPKISMPAPVYPTLTNYIPPYNPLFGSEEDSLNTCKGSLAGGSKVQKDGAKAQLFQGMILRFNATLFDPKVRYLQSLLLKRPFPNLILLQFLHTLRLTLAYIQQPADLTRTFIIQVHLEDDTVQIREPPLRNTGHKGGIFLSRVDVMMDMPDGSKRKFAPQDVVIGDVIKIRSHKFVVHDCDEYTYRFMEENSKQFLNSDIKLALEAIQKRQEVVTRLIITTPGLASKICSFEEIDGLMRNAKVGLKKQQIMTVLRALDPQRLGLVKMTQLLKMLMKQ